MDKKRLFVDMDGTLARFHDQVNYLERMFEKDFFRNLEPFENMVEAVRQFTELYPDVEVYILSAKVNGEPPYCEEEKHAWLDKHLPEIPRERRIFTEMGRPKAEFIPGGLTKNDFLLDDYNKGLNQFLYDGGSVIKCHNNINQKGLGSYGGQAGNLWVGKMVHVDDKPELIAAELAGHMGLEYDLERVAAAFPDISLSEGGITRKKLLLREDGDGYDAEELFGEYLFNERVDNPLNGLRYLAGKREFEEVLLKDGNNHFRLPIFQLQAICLNAYGDADYKRFRKADRSQLAYDAALALRQSETAVVGQIDYLYGQGQVGESVRFFDFAEMQKEIEDCRECGRPIDVRWNIQPPVKRMQDMSYFELEDLFMEEFLMDHEKASYLAQAYVTPKDRRTQDEKNALAEFASANTEHLCSLMMRLEAESLISPDAPAKPTLDSRIRSANTCKNTAEGNGPSRKGPQER